MFAQFTANNLHPLAIVKMHSLYFLENGESLFPTIFCNDALGMCELPEVLRDS